MDDQEKFLRGLWEGMLNAPNSKDGPDSLYWPMVKWRKPFSPREDLQAPRNGHQRRILHVLNGFLVGPWGRLSDDLRAALIDELGNGRNEVQVGNAATGRPVICWYWPDMHAYKDLSERYDYIYTAGTDWAWPLTRNYQINYPKVITLMTIDAPEDATISGIVTADYTKKD